MSKQEFYLEEEELVELFQEGKISMVDYVKHHSPEMTDDYNTYCNEEGLDDTTDDSAIRFLKRIESLL